LTRASQERFEKRWDKEQRRSKEFIYEVSAEYRARTTQKPPAMVRAPIDNTRITKSITRSTP